VAKGSVASSAFDVIKFRRGVAETGVFDAEDLSRSGDVGKLGAFLGLPGRTGNPLTKEGSVDIDEAVGDVRFKELLDFCCPMLVGLLAPKATERG
jgi:hypothetical protein